MNKIIFYVLESETKQSASKLWNAKKNSLFSFENNKFYFHSHPKNNKEEINVYYAKIKIQDIIELIDGFVKNAKKEASKISEEIVGNNKDGMNLVDSIKHAINKMMYIWEDDWTIFHLIVKMFIRIIHGHCLTNGNKRTGLVFLKLILWHFGYYLKWTSRHWANYSIYKTRIEEFVLDLEQTKWDTIEYHKVKKPILDWIYDCVIIGLNWR